MISLVTEYFLAIALFFSFITLIFYGFPVAWTMGGLGVLFIFISMLSDNLFDTFYGVDFGFASMVVYRLYGVMANWVLVALPMFIFMGIMMDKSGIAEDLMTDLSKLFGKTRGGLAISIVFIGVLLAASTGIIGAAVVLLTILGVPLMLKNNYNPNLACGVVCATGTLGILIPPSIMLVVMGPIMEIPVTDLFAAAIIPGIMLAVLYAAYVTIRCAINPSLGPVLAVEDRASSMTEVFREFIIGLVPPALLVFAALGSILFGYATPTEAAGCGAVGSLLLALAYKKLTLPKLQEALVKTLEISALIMVLVAASNFFGSVFSRLGTPMLLTEFLLGLEMNRYIILAIVLGMIFLLGWPLEWVPIVLIIIPIILPLIEALEFNLTWFAILVAVNLQTAWLSPPVALSAYFLKGVVPEWDLKDIYLGMMQFMVLQVIGLILIVIFPQIALWLPTYLYGN